MSDSISWSVKNLDRNTKTGAVSSAHWSAQLIRINPDNPDEPYVATRYGAVRLAADVESDAYIPYEELTPDVCLDWVMNTLTADKVNEIESGLLADVTQQEKPLTRPGVPWNK